MHISCQVHFLTRWTAFAAELSTFENYWWSLVMSPYLPAWHYLWYACLASCAAETRSLPRWIKRVCPWTEENVLLMSFLYTVNGNVDKYLLPWSTCFVAAVCGAQRHKRANYEKDELGWGAGWAATYFAAFLSIVWRYYFWDVNTCAAFVRVCSRGYFGWCMHGRNPPAGRREEEKEASECMCSLSANR